MIATDTQKNVVGELTSKTLDGQQKLKMSMIHPEAGENSFF